MNHPSFKYLIILLLFLTVKAPCIGQYYYYNNDYYDKDLIWEVGVSLGTMHAYTDVGRKKFNLFIPNNFDPKSTRANGTFYVGFLYQDQFGLRLEGTRGSIAAADSNATYKFRNTNFRSDILEVALVGELHPLNFIFRESLPRLSPYLSGGIGIFSFNPQTSYKGSWIDLQPLSTEGQGFKEYPNRKPYKLTSISIPFGAGLKYELSRIISIRGEVLARYTLTDYLDDAKDTSIDPDIYRNYFPEQKAMLAAALTNRTKERDPNSNITTVYKGGNRSHDSFVSVNLKFGLTLGRERIR